jgi:hypothetical protein
MLQRPGQLKDDFLLIHQILSLRELQLSEGRVYVTPSEPTSTPAGSISQGGRESMARARPITKISHHAVKPGTQKSAFFTILFLSIIHIVAAAFGDIKCVRDERTELSKRRFMFRSFCFIHRYNQQTIY